MLKRVALARDLGNQRGADRAQSGDADFQRWLRCHPNRICGIMRSVVSGSRFSDAWDDVVQLLGRVVEKAADVTRGLTDTLFVFDERDADKALAVFAEADARRHRDIGFLDQQLGKLHASKRLERLRVSEPTQTSTREASEHASPHARNFQPARRDDACKSSRISLMQSSGPLSAAVAATCTGVKAP